MWKKLLQLALLQLSLFTGPKWGSERWAAAVWYTLAAGKACFGFIEIRGWHCFVRVLWDRRSRVTGREGDKLVEPHTACPWGLRLTPLTLPPPTQDRVADRSYSLATASPYRAPAAVPIGPEASFADEGAESYL